MSNIKQKIDKQDLITVFGVIFLITIFLPIEQYYSEISNFKFELKDVILNLFFGFFLLFIIAIILLLVFNKKQGISTFFECLFIIGYLQYFIFNSLFNKIKINTLKFYYIKSIINFILWLILITIIIFLDKKIKYYISIILFCTLLLTTIAIMIKNKNIQKMQTKEFNISAEEQYTYSSKENIIILVLDCVPNSFMDEKMQASDKIKNVLKDFTYFDNCNGGYDGTYLGMNHLLTAQEYQFDKSFDDNSKFMWNSSKTNDMYQSIRDNGYKCYFYTDSNSREYQYEYLVDKFENIQELKEEDKKVNKLKATKTLLKISLGTIAPELLKEKILPDADDFLNIVTDGTNCAFLNSDYYNGLQNGLTLKSDKRFIIEHIMGMHPGDDSIHLTYLNDEKCEKKITVNSDKCFDGCIVLLDEYIQQLKKNNIYDNSTIIITSDHGEYSTYKNPQPIFFIKTKNETHAQIKINHAPISHENIMPTILEISGNDNYNLYGNSIFDIDENQKIERTFCFRTHSNSYQSIKKYNSDAVSSYNCVCQIKYIGDKNEIINQYKNHNYSIIQMVDSPW